MTACLPHARGDKGGYGGDMCSEVEYEARC